MLRSNFFGSVKKHAQRNASADALWDVSKYSRLAFYVCTIVMPGKAIWRIQNARNLFGGRSSAPDPAGRAYSTPQTP